MTMYSQAMCKHAQPGHMWLMQGPRECQLYCLFIGFIIHSALQHCRACTVRDGRREVGREGGKEGEG